jgi:acyl-CoA synthetase (AMP-forming)/AMP-acid ligase II
MQYNVADLFESVVDALPEDRVALVCGDERRTYRELEARANRIAHYLAGQGVSAGDHVALYLGNCAAYIETMLACMKLRAVSVNVNFRYVAEELRYLLDDSDSVALLHQRSYAPGVASVLPVLPKLRTRISVEDGSGEDLAQTESIDYEAAIAKSSPERDFAERSPDDVFVIYTGGTTGMPKGVLWRQEDFFFSALMGANPMQPPPERPEQVAERAREKPPMSMLTAAPLIHGAAQLGTLIALLQGYKACLVTRFDPELVWDTVEREGAQTLSIVGDAMGRPLAQKLGEPGFSKNLSSLAVLSSAGAILSPAVRDELKQHLPNLILLDAFGASETGSQGSEAGGVQADGGVRFRMNEQTVVLDEAGKRVEPGSDRVGRLALGGRIPLGYYKDPVKTAATFVEYEGLRYVLPGDLARPEADGTITVFGRGSQCINSGGEKIFPEEVEGALKSHPDVFDAVVVGIPDEKWGQRVAAVVQARPGRRVSLEDLATHARKSIAGYKVPRALELVDQIQRSPSGKPDYPWAKGLWAEKRDG